MEDKKMKPAYVVGKHHYCFRPDEPALILEIGTFVPEKDEESPRVCYRVVYGDGREDYIPVTDYENYTILGFDEVRQAYKVT